MGPRKKSKPNPKADAASGSPDIEPPPEASISTLPTSTSNDSGILRADAPSTSIADSTPTIGESDAAIIRPKTSRKWLGGGGSWRSKASATVKTAKESIGVSVSGGAASELPSEDSKPKDQSPTKFLTKRKSSKGDAIPAAMTKLTVSSDGSLDKVAERKPEETSNERPPSVDEPPLPPDPPKRNDASESSGTWGWRSWWSRPDGYSEPSKSKPGVVEVEEAQKTPLPGATPSEADAAVKELGNGKPSQPPELDGDVEMKNAPVEAAEVPDVEMKETAQPANSVPRDPSSTSWFWLWSSSQNGQSNAPTKPPPANAEATPKPDVPEPGPQATQPAQQPETAVDQPPRANTDENNLKETPKSSGWAFWFRDKPKSDTKEQEGVSHKHVGEVAVSDTPSQSNPEPAQFNEQEQPTNDAPKAPPQPSTEEPTSKRSFRSLRGRPKAKVVKDVPKDTPTDAPSSSKTATPLKASPEPSPIRPEPASAAQPALKQAPNIKQEPPNLILPEFQNTYRMIQQSSFWQQIRRYFLGGEPAMPHLHIHPAPPRVKKAVAIGVHGYFPAPMIQKVIGQPKGTSIRFANAAAAAINDWCDARGYTPDIEQIALEGEGFIADRVKTLWKLLLNWIEHIKAADFILVACHSQGVPVAIMLVAKLIQFGCVNASRIGICAMAGVNMGPFIEYKTKYFGATALELFEFSNPKSLVSQMYLAGLDEVLRFGVRILYVGSIDDQLVSLEVCSRYNAFRSVALTHITVFDILHSFPPLHLPRRLR